MCLLRIIAETLFAMAPSRMYCCSVRGGVTVVSTDVQLLEEPNIAVDFPRRLLEQPDLPTAARPTQLPNGCNVRYGCKPCCIFDDLLLTVSPAGSLWFQRVVRDSVSHQRNAHAISLAVSNLPRTSFAELSMSMFSLRSVA